MRQVSAQLLDHDSLVELESGHRLQLVQGGKTIAEIVPVAESSFEEEETRRLEAVRHLSEMLEKGMHLGGLRITNRDELYDRD
jgi:antitoxin (DNA-binding transcriptional repressor) of toxin-antitoxin stability system